tara:strand:+ start:875 stop:2113 length:1239 start_codon:yes stop_codon:yes gene_type:complete
MSKKRVVVTGIGTVNPLALNLSDSWNKLCNGESGIGEITQFDTSDLSIKIAGEVHGFDAEESFGKQYARKLDRAGHLTIYATIEALEDAGLDSSERIGPNCGIVIGTGIGGLTATENAVRIYDERGEKRVSPLSITQIMPNSSTGQASIKFGIEGPSSTITTACAASANAIGEAKRLIENDIVDMVVAGGTESATSGMTISAFSQSRALSSRNNDPEKASRPFDKDRDGFVMAEGCTMMFLESEESAKSRGANIYGYLVGYGSSTDAFHITAPSEGGVGASTAINAALKDANLDPEKVDYINAHGTSTKINDITETLAIKRSFGPSAETVAISSTKSMVGHLLGGAGAFESMVCLMSIKDGIIPPTINLDNPDEECDLNYTPNNSIEKDISYAMTNSFGFGGHNAVLIFKKS